MKDAALVSDPDIYRSAAVLIREHDENATLEAARLADAMLEKGDLDGQMIWKRILGDVGDLQETEAPEGKRRH